MQPVKCVPNRPQAARPFCALSIVSNSKGDESDIANEIHHSLVNMIQNIIQNSFLIFDNNNISYKRGTCRSGSLESTFFLKLNKIIYIYKIFRIFKMVGG